jgi:hypothetical protein
MKIIAIILSVLIFSSCGIMNNLTDEQLTHRNKIDYEANKLWNEYQYKVDSLYIEYYKK